MNFIFLNHEVNNLLIKFINKQYCWHNLIKFILLNHQFDFFINFFNSIKILKVHFLLFFNTIAILRLNHLFMKQLFF